MNVIYLDILFLINLTLDLLSLYLISHFVRAKLYPFRSFLACALASAASLWLLLSCYHLVLFLFVSLLLVVFITVLSFQTTTLKSTLRLSILFLFALFILGTFAYYILFLSIDIFGVTENTTIDHKAMLFSLISIVTGGILSLTSGMIKKQKEKKQVKVFIRMDDAQIDVECLVDSGNLVRDPIDGKPVIFIPHHKAVSLWGGRFADILEKGNFLAMSSEEFQIYQPKIRLVPCKTIHQGGLLMCIRADYIRIEDVGKEALIAICGDDKMSGCGICPASLL